MNIIITGEGEEIHFLIKSFLKKGNNITYISKDENFCKKIARIHDEIDVILGDPTLPNVLEEGEVFLGDLVLALGNYDPDNLIICQIAKQLYKVEKTLALVNDPKNIEIFKSLGVDVVISTANIISSLIEKKISAEEINSIVNMEEQRAAILEVTVPEGSPVIGQTLSQLSLPYSSLIGCILRDKKAIIPRGDTRILHSDKLVVITLDEAREELLGILRGKIC